MLLPGGQVLVADILNCRIVLLSSRRIARSAARRRAAINRRASSPSRTAPSAPPGGHFLVAEILGNWVDEMSLDGQVYWSAHPPGVSYRPMPTR